MHKIITNPDGSTSVVAAGSVVERKVNPDGSTSVIQIRVNPDGTESNIQVTTHVDGTISELEIGKNAGKIVVPPFVATDKEQKFLESFDHKGRIVRTVYVNPTRTIEFLPGRFVTNLVITKNSPLVSLVDVVAHSDKKEVATAILSFETNVLSSTVVYYSTSDISITLGVPQPVVTPKDALKVEQTNFSLAHSLRLEGLKANTVYHFAICVKDELGNENVTLSDEFTVASFFIK